MRILSALLLSVLLAGPAWAGDVSVRAPDGTRLHATLDGKGASGFLLVHGEGERADDLAPLANALVKAGHTVLSLDLRGHGPNGQTLDEAAWAAMSADVEAALSYLSKRPGVSKLVVVGSGVGATLALAAAADVPEVLDAVLLSPVITAHGHSIVAPLGAWGERAMLVMVGADDDVGRRTASAVAGKAKGRHAVEQVAGGGKGAGLFASGNTPVQAVLKWTRETLENTDVPTKDDIELDVGELETKGKRFGEE